MSNIERWEGEADAIEAWNYVIGRLHMLVNKPGEGMSADELLDEAEQQLRRAVDALRMAVADVNELDQCEPGQRIEPATVDGYLTASGE